MRIVGPLARMALGFMQDLDLENIPQDMWRDDHNEHPRRLRVMRAATLCVDDSFGLETKLD